MIAMMLQALDRENEMPTTEHQMSIERVHSTSHKLKDKVQSDAGSSAIKEYHNYKLVVLLVLNRASFIKGYITISVRATE